MDARFRSLITGGRGILAHFTRRALLVSYYSNRPGFLVLSAIGDWIVGFAEAIYLSIGTVLFLANEQFRFPSFGPIGSQ